MSIGMSSVGNGVPHHNQLVIEDIKRRLHHPQMTAPEVGMAVSLAVSEDDRTILSDLLQKINDTKRFLVFDWVSILKHDEQWTVLKQADSQKLYTLGEKVATKLIQYYIGTAPQLRNVEKLGIGSFDNVSCQDEVTTIAVENIKLLEGYIKPKSPFQVPNESPDGLFHHVFRP